MGPMTGRRAGYCSGNGAPGYTNPVRGGGYGGGRGGGRGHGGGYGRGFGFRAGWNSGFVPPLPAAGPTWSQEQETQSLKSQAQYLEQTLENIKKSLAQLEKDADKPD